MSDEPNEPKPNWDLDYAVGRQAEMWVSDIRKALESGTVEVKRDRRAVDTGNIYVEYRCLRKKEWQPSGIATTKAQLYVFVLIEGEFAVVITTDRLKALARKALKDPRNLKEEKDGSHPTKGVIIPIRTLMTAILSQEKSA